MTNTSPMDEQNPLIVIASNRGPFKFTEEADGKFTFKRGAGGLVTALAALAEKYDVLWVACALKNGDRAWAEKFNHQPHTIEKTTIRLISPEETTYDQYYNVISNPLLWFIHHQLWGTPRKPVIDKTIWEAWASYQSVNRQFAEAIADSVQQAVKEKPRPVIVFPQDYQLHLVPYYLRELLGFEVQIQPFLHIPWPGPDAWRILPSQMREELLHSLLMSDRIGFQTQRDAFNFVQTARFYLDNAHSHGARDAITYHGRRVQAKSYPISIDVEKVQEMVKEAQTELFKAQIVSFVSDRKVILRTDRIEPSKNILRGLQAYRALLEEHPEHRGKVVMFALLVPSRMEVGEYRDYMRDIMAEGGMINATYSDGIWEPVRIIVGDNYYRALAAMQLYDVLLVNPLADGMNLVAKEGVLVNQRDGVLLLSEHAGAFYELGKHALTVSPFDVYGTMQMLHQALTMSADEKRQRAQALTDIVIHNDVRQWFKNQVEDALLALNQPKNDSTPPMPATNTSAAARTNGGVSGDSTPTATA